MQIIGSHPDQTVAPVGTRMSKDCGRLAGLGHSTHWFMCYRTRAELTRQLHTPVCAMSVAANRPQMTLHCLCTLKSSLKSHQVRFPEASPTKPLHSDSAHRENNKMCCPTLECISGLGLLGPDACAVNNMHRCTQGTRQPLHLGHQGTLTAT